MKQYPVYPQNILVSAKHEVFFEQLSTGQLQKVIDTVTRNTRLLPDLIHVLTHPQLEIHVRVGVSAVLEALAGHPDMVTIIPALIKLTSHQQVHLRSDACYFLGLTESNQARPALKLALKDFHPEVQQAATEALEYLDETSPVKH